MVVSGNQTVEQTAQQRLHLAPSQLEKSCVKTSLSRGDVFVPFCRILKDSDGAKVILKFYIVLVYAFEAVNITTLSTVTMQTAVQLRRGTTLDPFR